MRTFIPKAKYKILLNVLPITGIGTLKLRDFGIIKSGILIMKIRSTCQEKLKEKIGVDFTNYVILGACNPPLAYQALQQEMDLGLLLPCNVVVRQDAAGKVFVEAMDPLAVLDLVGRQEIAQVAIEIRQRLDRAMKEI